MARKNFSEYTRFLSISLLLLLSVTARPCTMMEDADAYRLMFFQARLANAPALQLFNYSPNLYASYQPDPEGADRIRNGKEWQSAVGNDVAIEDIIAILYDMAPDSVLNANAQNQIATTFADNAFMQALIKPANKALLEYLLFAKQVEATELALLSSDGSEQWDAKPNDNDAQKEKLVCFNIAKKRLSLAKTDFLRKRYAYQVCRLAYQLKQYNVVTKTYESRFKKFNGDDLMNVWSTLFYAICLDIDKKGAKANYLYSLAFDNSDSKKLRSHQLFHTDEKTFAASLKLAKTDHEKAVLWTMRIINYPGPALKELKIISTLEPKSPYISFLMGREINKLEDWICTPAFTDNIPSVSAQWDMNIAKAKNLANDLAYLAKFKVFMKNEQQEARGELRQYITLGLAHLCLLGDNTKEGIEYLNALGLSDNSSMETQKNIEKAWIMAKTTDVTSDTFKDQFVIYCHKLERLAKSDIGTNKTLYSLLLGVAHEYEKRNDFATGGLLTMKSTIYKMKYDTAYYSNEQITMEDVYDKISYFDENASISDMDHLFQLMYKKDKSDFEDYICDQHLGSIDFYRDLQGTMAFRENNLALAYKIFRLIGPTFWKSHDRYKYLNEDPFFPKVLAKTRNFKYPFDKSKFVKQLIDLQERAKKKSGTAEAALQLANAYFNCSYWGNSWMMVKYEWSNGDSFINSKEYRDSLGYHTSSTLPKRASEQPLLGDNYYTCTLASFYYRQALNDPKATNEQKAFACLMLHECGYYPWSFANFTWDNDKVIPFKAGEELSELYSTYKGTKVYHDYKCPLLDAFIAGK